MNIIGKKIKIIALLLIGLMLSNSCTDGFEELNSNPNDPTIVSPEVLLPGALRLAVRRTHGDDTRLERLNIDGGMLWVQYFARNQYTNEGDTYNPDAQFTNNNWSGLYKDVLINFQKIVDISTEEGGQYEDPNFTAVGIICKEWIFSIITDTWGAVPYSEALIGASEGILTPAYDSQEAIYDAMLANLKSASDMLEPGATIKGDILFNGSGDSWKKFANSLRLRLANRIAAKKPGAAQAVFTEIMGNPTQYPIFEGNGEQAELVHEGRPSNNPWHEVMVQSAREDWSISNTLIDAMTDGEGNPTDPRITVYAEKAFAGPMEGKYAGAPNGLPEAIASDYINTASRPGSFFLGDKTPAVILGYSELLFIMAEAALDGDLTGGMTAKEYLDMAVTASFDYYGLTAPDGYLAGLTVDKETIMTEKWKALFGQGVEAWTEYRRTGFPVLPDADPRAIFENDGMVPTRIDYPNSEYSLNSSNLETGISLNGGPDNKQTKMWWAE